MEYNIKHIALPGGPEIAYIDEGQGATTLLFVHGLGSTHRVWQRNVEELSPYYRCIAIDLPGYGDSAKADYPISMVFFAETLSRLVTTLGLDHYVPVGHSMGGQIVMTALLGGWLSPARAILFAPAGIETFSEWEKTSMQSINQVPLLKAQTKEQIRRNFHYNFYETPDDALPLLDERLALMRQRAAYDYYLQLTVDCVNAMLEAPVYERLGGINIPVLLMYGEDDKLIPNRFLHPQDTTTGIGRQAQEAIPYCQLEMLSEAGHFVQWERAREAGELIKDFVGILSSADDEGTEAVITGFYDHFVAADAAGLLAHYHPDAVYDSPLTGELRGEALRQWWQLLCGQQGGTNRAALSQLDADDYRARLEWRLHYRYRAAAVALSGQAHFEFAHGRILSHHDDFSVWTWASQTDGWRGWSMGWSSVYQARLKAEIRRKLGLEG